MPNSTEGYDLERRARWRGLQVLSAPQKPRADSFAMESSASCGCVWCEVVYYDVLCDVRSVMCGMLWCNVICVVNCCVVV